MASYALEQALVEPVITSWNSSWPNGLAAFLGGIGLGVLGCWAHSVVHLPGNKTNHIITSWVGIFLQEWSFWQVFSSSFITDSNGSSASSEKTQRYFSFTKRFLHFLGYIFLHPSCCCLLSLSLSSLSFIANLPFLLCSIFFIYLKGKGAQELRK